MPIEPDQTTKYAAEILDETIEFIDRIGLGTISSASSLVSPGTSLTVTSVTPSGSQVAFRVSGGTPAEWYNVDISISMSNGEKLNHRIIYSII